MDWGDWTGKRIYVVLTNGLEFSGLVIDSDENFIKINDKFDKIVTFKTSDISTIQEKRRDR